MFTDLNDKQIRVFEIFDNLIRQGFDVYEVIRNDESLRKRVNRNFERIGNRSKVKSALFMYGFNDITYTLNPLELKRCWNVSENGVEVDENHLAYLSSISGKNVSDILEEANGFKQEAIREFLSLFLSKECPSKITLKNIRRRYPKVYNTVRKVYPDADSFYEEFGINKHFSYFHSLYGNSFIKSLGLIFESMVREYLFPDSDYQVMFKDCIPDFIVNGKWIDVKLSRGTALNKSDNTIEKYLKYVDHLIIIYALDGEMDKSIYEDLGYVTFKHISDFYTYIEEKHVIKFEEFINSSYRYKRWLYNNE